MKSSGTSWRRWCSASDGWRSKRVLPPLWRRRRLLAGRLMARKRAQQRWSALLARIEAEVQRQIQHQKELVQLNRAAKAESSAMAQSEQERAKSRESRAQAVESQALMWEQALHDERERGQLALQADVPLPGECSPPRNSGSCPTPQYFSDQIIEAI